MSKRLRGFRIPDSDYELIKSFGKGNASVGLQILIDAATKFLEEKGIPISQLTTAPVVSKKPRGLKYSEDKSNYHKMAWEEYSIAYNAKYGAKPISNQTTFSQMINVCKRLNYKNVEQVIKFYLGHNNRYYSMKAHSVGMLLTDCEKLHTEWTTNQKITDQKIKSESFGDGIREQLKRLSQNDNIDF